MNKTDLPFTGKVTLVTGAAGGIGKALCYEFARLGSTVCMCDISDTSGLANEIDEACNTSKPISFICDISDSSQIEDMIQKIKKTQGGVDILINNAAINGPKGDNTFPNITYEAFKKTIDIDLSAAVWLSLAVLPHMRSQNWGRILFTAAPRSSSGIPAPYLAGKTGFISMAKSLYSQYGEEGIRTLSLALRHTETPMIRRVIASKGIDVEEGLKKMHSQSLTGKMIQPEEIAKLYSWFAAAENSEISCFSMLSDGGITIMR